jgi:hypothetical protein
MRAAAVALVLIVGAAVVLWYGNTLNSLVLGGLIGGLAALLLSIPISLVLFSYFSRRHEDQLRAEVQEEMSLAQIHEYEYLEVPEDVYETEAQMLPPAEYHQGNYRVSTGRNLVPSYPLSPPTRQNQPAVSESQAYHQRTTEYPLRQLRQPKSAPLVPYGRGNGNALPSRNPNAARQGRYPGFPGYQPTSSRARHQTAALRAARQEAAQQYDDDDLEVYPGSPSKKLPTVRPVQKLVPEQYRPRVNRPAQKPHPQGPDHYRSKRTIDGSSVPPGYRRALPEASESLATETSQETYYRSREQQTDQLRRSNESMTRNPRFEAQLRNPEIITGSLKNPLVRRAPYMYEDDPLRQELAQQIDVPTVQRRASRYEEEDQDY